MKTKQKYDIAKDRLKELLDRKKELQAEELISAVVKSKRPYDDIIRYINSEPEKE